MNTRRLVPWCLCPLLLTVGCSHSPDVVGTWVGQQALPGAGRTARSEIILRENGTFHKKGGAEAEYNGTYTVAGNSLTQKFTSYSVQGHVMDIPADAPNVETDTFTLKDDTLTLTPQGGQPQVLTRQRP